MRSLGASGRSPLSQGDPSQRKRLGQLQARDVVSPGQPDPELLAAQAHQDRGVPGLEARQPHEALQCLITAVVAVAVVDLPEVIEVQQHQRQRRPWGRSAGPGLAQPLVRRPAVQAAARSPSSRVPRSVSTRLRPAALAR